MNQAHAANTIIIFTDAATSQKTETAVGAFLCLDMRLMSEYAEYTHHYLAAKLADVVTYKTYESKKSTWAEIKTAIDALYTIQNDSVRGQKVEIYTDCQSLCDLLGRRKERLLKNNFITRSGKVLKNSDLYKELFSITEKFQITMHKMKGHDTPEHRLTIQEKIFALLDKLSRNKLRSVL
jgi:ribonuclease HI